ncbi:MAG: hypothetical protein J6Q80_06665, partial [Lentisphaeria bacterium]|nr:hypothetical protein [Lentisphaeria bacterium]
MKTAKIILLSMMAAGISFLTACSTCAEVQKERSCAVKVPEKRIKVGYYIDDGSRSGGVHHIARMLYYSPQFEVTLIDGKDLRDGKLTGLDLFVIPGGSSEMQYIKMGEAGAEAVRKFVREGGAFYGICAGFHCSINKPTRLRLMPYEHIPGGYGNVADLSIDISEEGAKLLNVSPGR